MYDSISSARVHKIETGFYLDGLKHQLIVIFCCCSDSSKCLVRLKMNVAATLGTTLKLKKQQKLTAKVEEYLAISYEFMYNLRLAFSMTHSALRIPSNSSLVN